MAGIVVVIGHFALSIYFTTQLSGAHAFRRFLRQLLTDSHEILNRTFLSYVLTWVKI